MTVQPKTLEEHRDYLHEVVKLKLFFMHDWLARHPDEAPVDVLRQRVDIYRKTDANPGMLNPPSIDWNAEAWQALERPLLECYARYRDDGEAFEREGFGILRPSLDARCERDFLDDSPLKAYQCGSLRYNVYKEPTARVGFHIANAVCPRSIFDNPHYLPACFLALMEHAEALYGAVEIDTGTWLNENPKWLAIFPQEWHDNLSPRMEDVQWHYGFWGQFITGRGTFNRKMGEYLRRNRRLHYYPRRSFVAIATFRRHLLERFRQG